MEPGSGLRRDRLRGLRHRRSGGFVPSADLFSVETLFLKSLHVPFFIELGTSRVRLAGVTRSTDAAWVAQQTRNLSHDLANGASQVHGQFALGHSIPQLADHPQ